MRRRQLLVWLATGTVLLACREQPTPTAVPGVQPTPPVPSPTVATTPATSPSPTIPVTPVPSVTPVATPEAGPLVGVYFLRGDKLAVVRRPIAQTPRVGLAALQELVAGPTAREAAWGFTTEIPAGTRVRDLAISEGIATVDLSSAFAAGGGSFSMRARVAQVVFTLTQFPTVQAVRFQLDGQPLDTLGGEGVVLEPPPGRSDFEDLLPLIFVEEPGPGETVKSPLRVRGSANTFEASFMVRLATAEGATLLEQPAMATSGSGTRGTFDLVLAFSVAQPTEGTLRLWEYSARDGAEINVVEIPLRLEP